jgi:predicted enzyme related to lactoylglutathione lyase
MIFYDSGVIVGFPGLVPSVSISFVQGGISQSLPIALKQPLAITATSIMMVTFHGRAEAQGRWQIVPGYEMPPKEGISIAHFLTVADVERSARYYEKVFGARILTMGDGNAPPYLQLANIWMILNVGGGPTPDKPTVTLSVPDPNHINSFMNFRVADIQACYELWKSRGAEFITPPIPKYGEIRCYIRDPDGYIIEVGQSTDLTYG